MSLAFSNTTSKNGILQRIERTCGFQDGDITGNTTMLAQFTGDVNVALDRVLSLIFSVGGTWQFDDYNHTDYPIITTNLVSGQRDYTFTSDESGNLILEIYKVLVADDSGDYREILPVDQQSDAPVNYTDGNNTTGLPITYDKTGNGIFLDPIPNYNETNGLKIYINREASYFTTSDTTKKPGFAGLFHEYLVLHPSFYYCLRNGISIRNSIKEELMEMEAQIMDFYKMREKDTVKRLIGARNNSN